VMVQLCCCVFTFVVFVGDGWMPLLPAHLPHLRLLSLQDCKKVRYKYIADILAAIPDLAVIKCRGNVVGGPTNKQMKAVYSELLPGSIYKDMYSTTRQFALDR
jgi:hypothetical protein